MVTVNIVLLLLLSYGEKLGQRWVELTSRKEEGLGSELPEEKRLREAGWGVPKPRRKIPSMYRP